MEGHTFFGGCYFPHLFSAILSLPTEKTLEQALLIDGQLQEEATRLDAQFIYSTEALQLLRGTYQKDPTPLSHLKRDHYEHLLSLEMEHYCTSLEKNLALIRMGTGKESFDLETKEYVHMFVLGVAKSEYNQLITANTTPRKIIGDIANLYLDMVKDPTSLKIDEIYEKLEELNGLSQE